jgi:hypothetical protein
MAKKKFDPKAKAKRQKVFLAVGGVLLLALLAFQVPRTMKMMKSQTQSSSSSTPPATTTTAAGSTPLAPPSLNGSSTAATSGSSGTSAAASTATTADGVSDPSNPLPPNAGQLVSFSKFKSKDPFHQQITDCGTVSAGTAAGGCGAGSTPGSSKPGSTTKPVSSNVQPTLIGPRAKPISGKAAKATISVNGVASTVKVGTSFPAAAPVFTLVSLTATAAKIGIAGGSYENGAATVTLKKGQAVTLLNTASGTRYILRLVSAS